MIFNRDFYLIVWWSILVHVNLITTERDNDHVHIKVHVPQIYKKHFHHRSIAKHHFHHPKKIQFQQLYPETVTTHIEPEIDFPLLSAPGLDKYIKWQEKEHTPLTWYNDAPTTGFIAEKSKTFKPPLNIDIDEYKILNGKNNYKNFDLEPEYVSKYTQQYSPHQNNIKEFRINTENDYKKHPIKQYSNYRDDDDDEDQEQRDEYTEEDTDSYLENTEAINPHYSQQSMTIIRAPNNYYDSLSHSNDDYYTSYNSDPDSMQNGKRAIGNYSNNNKKQKYGRPYRDRKESSKFYDENGWTSHASKNHFSEWNPNNFGKSPVVEINKLKLNGRKPFGFGPSSNEYHIMNHANNNNNFESSFGKNPELTGLNEYRIKNKRPKRKPKPKWNRHLQNGSTYNY